MKLKDAEFGERRSAARDAKAALLARVKAKQSDPAAEARRIERAAIAAAREEREAAKRAEMERQKREEAERQAVLAAQKAAEESVTKADLVTRALQDEAARKAARDERYAARQSRKG